MSYTSRLPAFTAGWEQLRLRAYWDGATKPDGTRIWTCGFGHTRGVTGDTTCSAEQAQAWLRDDLDGAALGVARNVSVALTPNQFDALTDFVFVMGEPHLIESTLLKMVNAGLHERAAVELVRWNKFRGKVQRGQLARRAGEVLIYAFADYTGV